MTLPSRSGVTWVLLFLLVQLSVVVQAKKKTWKVYHRVVMMGFGIPDSMNNWEQRGTIVLSDEEPTDDTAAAASSTKSIDLQIQNSALATTTWTRELTHKVVSEESTTNRYWYQIRLVPEDEEVVVEDNLRSSSTTNLLATVPACDLRRANFRDEFVLHFQQGTGRVLSMSYIPLISPLAPKTCREYKTGTTDEKEYSLDSRISWETAIPAMTVGKPPAKDAPKIKPPPGLKWLPGLNKKDSPFSDEDKQKQQQPEPGLMGFFRRYWYILVPLMVINLMSSEQPSADATTATPTATGAAAATTAAAAAAAATSPRAATATGTSPRQRRGKRD